MKNRKKVIIGQLEPFQNNSEKYLKKVPGKQDIKKLQKTAILNTDHTISKSSNV
jgi:hypothetical protein